VKIGFYTALFPDLPIQLVADWAAKENFDSLEVDFNRHIVDSDSAICLPFALTILRPFFRSIPRELSEAARIDGCSPFSAFRRVILPLSAPAVLTVGIFTFLAAWGDLLMALSLITDEAMRPVTSGLFKYMGNNVSQWNMVMGFATLEMIPPWSFFWWRRNTWSQD
jgi:ABC-type glycerol-3-phosphate transport system permease component